MSAALSETHRQAAFIAVGFHFLSASIKAPASVKSALDTHVDTYRAAARLRPLGAAVILRLANSPAAETKTFARLVGKLSA
jgi:hypothetical protein